MARTEAASIAEKLPFDVLCHIFKYYAQTETVEHPLETLFLVCRSWSTAVQDYSYLWSTIVIKFEDLQELKAWEQRVPGRLGRCMADSLFTIQIMDLTKTPRRSVEEFKYTITYDKLLGSLAGIDGCHIHRWQKLTAITQLNLRSRLGTYLSYPLPNIEELDVTGIYPTGSPFPYTPMLKRFHSPSRWPSAFPDLTTIEDLGFDHNYIKEENLVNCTSVLKVTTYNAEDAPYCIPAVFPSVTHLCLSWPSGQGDEGEGYLVTPALKHLELCARSREDFYWVIECEGLPLDQVEQATITSKAPLFDNLEDIREGFCALLTVMTGLKTLEVKGSIMRKLVAAMISNEEIESLGEGDSLLDIGGNKVKLDQGVEAY